MQSKYRNQTCGSKEDVSRKDGRPNFSQNKTLNIRTSVCFQLQYQYDCFVRFLLKYFRFKKYIFHLYLCFSSASLCTSIISICSKFSILDKRLSIMDNRILYTYFSKRTNFIHKTKDAELWNFTIWKYVAIFKTQYWNHGFLWIPKFSEFQTFAIFISEKKIKRTAIKTK